jgi:integrase
VRSKRNAASCARDPLAVELLLTCSMRVGNLANLRVGETIRKYGQGPGGRWIIEIPGDEVKNGQPLRYALLPESSRLVEWYLVNWHAYWCGPDAPWLFPGSRGGHVEPRLLTIMIAKRARQYVGTEITCHQFRHLAAELYLREDPTGLGIVSEHWVTGSWTPRAVSTPVSRPGSRRSATTRSS